jgi:hypothetical protein
MHEYAAEPPQQKVRENGGASFTSAARSADYDRFGATDAVAFRRCVSSTVG